MTDMQPLQVSVKEAAQFLGVCRQTLARMRGNGEIILGRIRGRVFVPVAELKRLRPAAEVDRFLCQMEKRRREKKPRPVLYFVDCGEFTKIGFTAKGAEARMAGIATGNPFDLHVWGTIPGDQQLEREMHALFARYRYRGEWFRFDAKGRSQAFIKIKELGGKVNSGNYWRGVWRNGKDG